MTQLDKNNRFTDSENPQNQKRGKKTPRPPKKITESYLHNAGIYYLQRFAASSSHFRTIMSRKINRSCRHHKDQNKDDCMQLLETLIIKFQETGLLNDADYAKGMVTSLRRRGLSANAIYAKLLAKGLPKGQIKFALDEHDEAIPENAELISGLRLARRKRLGHFDATGTKNHEKSLGALARAGYGFDIAKRILEMDIAEAEDLIVSSDR